MYSILKYFYHMVRSIKNPSRLLPMRFGLKNIFLVIVIVGLAGTAIYFQQQYKGLRENPNKIIQAETKALLADVGKLMVLPEGEEPVIATVNDPEQLADQTFFTNAKVGDKVIIYAQSGKAVLYDPIAKKIIDISPININNDQVPPPAPVEVEEAEEPENAEE